MAATSPTLFPPLKQVCHASVEAPLEVFARRLPGAPDGVRAVCAGFHCTGLRRHLFFWTEHTGRVLGGHGTGGLYVHAVDMPPQAILSIKLFVLYPSRTQPTSREWCRRGKPANPGPVRACETPAQHRDPRVGHYCCQSRIAAAERAPPDFLSLSYRGWPDRNVRARSRKAGDYTHSPPTKTMLGEQTGSAIGSPEESWGY